MPRRPRARKRPPSPELVTTVDREAGIPAEVEASAEPAAPAPAAMLEEAPEVAESGTVDVVAEPPVEVLIPGHDPRLARAEELERDGEYERAVELYREVLLEQPENVRIRLRLGALYDRRNDPVLALEQFEAARAVEPDNPEVLLNVGSMLGALGRFDKAERELKRAAKLGPTRADIPATLGLLLYKRGLYAEAEAELQRALSLDPEDPVIYFYRGEALNRLGRVDESLEMLERSVYLKPNNAKAYHTMGILYDKKHLREEAQAMYRKAREVAAT